jgi:hypothetical protein
MGFAQTGVLSFARMKVLELAQTRVLGVTLRDPKKRGAPFLGAPRCWLIKMVAKTKNSGARAVLSWRPVNNALASIVLSRTS